MASRFWEREFERYYDTMDDRNIVSNAWYMAWFTQLAIGGLELLKGRDIPFSLFVEMLILAFFVILLLDWAFRSWLRQRYAPRRA